MKLFMTSFCTLLILASCSSNQIPKEDKAGPQSAPLVQRKYILRDRSHNEAPVWTYDLMAYELKAPQESKFFVGESGDVNDKIAGCDMAKARAKQELSQEIVTFVKSKMSDSAEGQAVINKLSTGNPALERKFTSLITQESVAMLAGVKVVSTSWEERDYSQTGGASSVFVCKALVMMNKKTLDSIIEKATKKASEELAN